MDQATPYQHYQQNQAQMPSQPNHMNPSHISSIPTQQQQVDSNTKIQVFDFITPIVNI